MSGQTNAGALAAPIGAVRTLALWHRVECLIAVAAFGFIAAVLIGRASCRERVSLNV